jgi:uroporphyrin-III C-methyltransferase
MPTAPVRSHRARPGWVYLVGSGPGDPGLVTVKARDLLESCDCVLHDRLGTREVLSYAPSSAERIDVGKIGHGCQVGQDEIHRLLVDRARQGRRVVRLKGGCPTVFGRLTDEVDALRDAGVPCEVVPGVTSATAVPAAAGISITERGVASTVAIVAGHCTGPARSLAAVAHADTVVMLMGARQLASLATQLVALGRPPHTPAAFISDGTGSRQRTVRATLATLAEEVRRAGVGAPAVVVVGDVASVSRVGRFGAGAAEATADIPVASHP